MRRSIAPVGLVPVEPDPSAAGAGWPWLRVEVDAARLAGRIVRLRYRSGLLEPLVRPVLRCVGASHRADRMLPAALFGRAMWLGQIPHGTRELWVSPTNRPGPFAFAIDAIELPSSLSLAVALARRSPRAWFYWAFAPLVGLKHASEIQVRRQLSPTPIADYEAWRRSHTRPFDPQGFDKPTADAERCHLRVVVSADAGQAGIAALLGSLEAQPHPAWSVALVGRHGSGTPPTTIAVDPDAPWHACATGLRGGDLLVPLALGDVLAPEALATFAQAAALDQDAAGFYADADGRQQGRGPRSPLWRSDWPALAGLIPFDSGPVVALRPAALASGPELTAADLAGGRAADALAGRGLALRHIRRVLLTTARTARARPIGPPPPPPREAEASATIVIPTRDRLDLLERCIDSIRPCLAAGAELVVVDNGSTEPATLTYLEALAREERCTVLADRGPFNFSRLCNAGAALGRAPVLVFLNNDTEAVDAVWLERLLRWTVDPRVGAVGAKLLYPDGSVQHAGVVLGIDDLAGHFERGCGREEPGFFDRLTVPHEVTAVTAACLAVERRKFEAVSGFDEARLPVDLNDIDLCLRLGERGWRCLLDPDAVLIHHESASRGVANRPDLRYRGEQTYVRTRWADLIRDDPHFHPALSVDSLSARLG